MIYKSNMDSIDEHQEKEIRALALQAAAIIFSGKAEITNINEEEDTRPTELEVLDVATFFENYIRHGK